MPSHEITVVVGRTGSGKTQLISRVLAPRHPRRITLDATGECVRLYPAAHVVGTLADALRALEVWANEEREHWHLVAALQPADSAEFARALVPVYSPGVSALADDLGGVCVECSELDVYLPVSGANAKQTAAWTTVLARGRHTRCSVIAATQRPHQVARIVTSQASRVIAFRTHEPRDVRWLADVGGPTFAAVAREDLPRFHSVHFHVDDARCEVLDERYRVTRRFPAWPVRAPMLGEGAEL